MLSCSAQPVPSNLPALSVFSIVFHPVCHPPPCPLLAVIQNQIDFGSFPSDPSAVYVLLPSSDLIDAGQFCDPHGYCGFHARFNDTAGRTLAFAFIGHADNCLRSCAPQK